MNRNRSIDIHCEIETVEQSFRGRLRNEAGVSRSFSGWTEFATALVALARDTGDETNHETNEEKHHEENH